MKEYAIIVAGGIGSRMKSEIPKQFLLVDGVPIIVQTISKFISYNSEIEIIVVLPEDHIDQWKQLSNQYFVDVSIASTIGGVTRTESVMAGLGLIEGDGIVAIHDAVRPFVSTNIIAKSFQSAIENGSGVAAVTMKDSLRELMTENSSKSRDRSKFVLVQTPQTFQINKLKEAYKMVGENIFSDDATVFEKVGFSIHLIEGSYANIKITTPEDLP